MRIICTECVQSTLNWEVVSICPSACLISETAKQILIESGIEGSTQKVVELIQFSSGPFFSAAGTRDSSVNIVT